MKWLLATIAIFLTAHSVNPTKVLLILPSSYSVCMELVAIGEELVLRGHEVVALIRIGIGAQDNNGCPGDNGMRLIISRHDIDSDKGMEEFQKETYNDLFSESYSQRKSDIGNLRKYLQVICQSALADPVALRQVEEERFGFALVEGTLVHACLAIIPYKFRIPYGIVGSYLSTWPNVIPFMPQLVPNVYTPYTDDMTLLEVGLNAIAYILPYFVGLYSLPMEEINAFAPELTRRATMNLFTSAELYFENLDSVLGYIAPRMPNYIQVGGLLTKPAIPLPHDLDSFLNNAKEGAVLVSFGSVLQMIPEEIEAKFLNVFSRLNVSVIWKHPMQEKIGNIFKKKWIPQNDILAHRNIRLMIYHCGNNGIFEALYHGVPVICMPFLYDQPYNARKVLKWGVGKSLDIRTVTSDQLLSTIRDVLTNESYSNNMKKWSSVYHSYPETARQRAAYWVDHVMKHGSEHLQSNARSMSPFRFMLVDLFLVCFLVASIFSIIFIWITWKVCRKVCQNTNTDNKIKKN